MNGNSMEGAADPFRPGDVAAFERHYRANVARILGLCLRLTGDRAEAEEFTQEAFIKAWEALPSFRGESSFSTWLHRLTVNVVLGRLRSSSRRSAMILPMEDPDEIDRTSIRKDETGSRSGETMDLEQAIAALPTGARTVFILHDVEGYRHEEIAEMMGVTAGTSKGQLHRARKLLREALSEGTTE